jgi:hypothetical protein
MAGDVEPNPGPTAPTWHAHPLYFEPQEERFCIAHAFNAFVGCHVVSGQTLLDYCNLIKNALPSNTFMHMGVFDDQSVHLRGNFSQLVLDHWLYHGCGKNLCFIPTSTQLHKRMQWSDKLHMLEGAGAHSYLLSWGEETGDPYGHIACVKKYNNVWFLIDSEAGMPRQLDQPRGPQRPPGA